MKTYQETKATIARMLRLNTDDYRTGSEMMAAAEEEATNKPYHGDGVSPLMELRMNEFATIAKFMVSKEDNEQEGEQ